MIDIKERVELEKDSSLKNNPKYFNLCYVLFRNTLPSKLIL